MPTKITAEKPMKSKDLQDRALGKTGEVENFGTLNCANRRRDWHGWHTPIHR